MHKFVTTLTIEAKDFSQAIKTLAKMIATGCSSESTVYGDGLSQVYDPDSVERLVGDTILVARIAEAPGRIFKATREDEPERAEYEAYVKKVVDRAFAMCGSHVNEVCCVGTRSEKDVREAYLEATEAAMSYVREELVSFEEWKRRAAILALSRQDDLSDVAFKLTKPILEKLAE